MNKPQKILILSSGGDSPGMNAAIRAAVRTALYYDLEVYGCRGGYQGLVERAIFPLMTQDVANCIQRGGTILQTGRCEAFLDAAVRAECVRFLQKQGIDGLVVLGGDGSFRGASLMYEQGGPAVVGIPCTIDNDIEGTDYTIGFDTACNTALAAIDKIRDTAFSFNRNFLVEVMGRAAGFLAVEVGIAGGAEFILVPEAPTSVEELVKRLQNRGREKLSSIIVVAEANEAGHSFELAAQIKQLSGINYRVCVLGHTQRGGSPTARDRTVASMMGARAIEALQHGESQKMVAMTKGEIALSDFPKPDQPARCFNQIDLLVMNQIICNI